MSVNNVEKAFALTDSNANSLCDSLFIGPPERFELSPRLYDSLTEQSFSMKHIGCAFRLAFHVSQRMVFRRKEHVLVTHSSGMQLVLYVHNSFHIDKILCVNSLLLQKLW